MCYYLGHVICKGVQMQNQNHLFDHKIEIQIIYTNEM